MLFGFLLPVISMGQDITGVWKGELYVDSTKRYYPFELTISQDNGKFTGYSRISFEENGKQHVVFRDHSIKLKDDAYIIEDDSQLAKVSSISTPRDVKKTMVLSLISRDSTFQLNGTWSTNKTRRYLAATGSVKMQKKKDFRSTEIFKTLDSISLTKKMSFNKEPEKIPEPKEELPLLQPGLLANVSKKESPRKKITITENVIRPNLSLRPRYIPFAIIRRELPPAVVKQPEPVAAVVKKPATTVPKEASIPVAKIPAPVVEKPVVKKNVPLPERTDAATEVEKRSAGNIQSLFYKTDSLQLTLYDNGEIDGDTVSVLLNGKVIIAKKALDVKPNVFTIYFDRDTPDSQMLVMYAENLGSIPPNTGLLVVREGPAVYELRFSADLKTNASIVLRRRKEE